MIESIALFFTSGGSFMWLILILFAVAMAVVIERLVFFLVTCRNDSAVMVADVATALNAGDLDQARAAVSGRNAPLNAIMGAAVERYALGLPYKDIRQGVEEVAIKEVPRLSQRISYLAMFANIATLTGLLGTIFGLQRSFSSLAVAEAAQKAAMLAEGISQAMNTTAFGLIVAIPCLIAYAKISTMQARLSEDLDASSIRLLNYMESRLEGQRNVSRMPVIDRVVVRDNEEASLSESL
jgi:biopolymer transport protein ExbB